jgi:hypothetical protein
MKATNAVSLALFLGSMTLLAQTTERNSGRNPTKPAVASVALPTTNCPINMQARRQSSTRQALIGKNAPSGPKQNLLFTVINPTFQQVVRVHITVHGLNANARVSPAQTAAMDSSEITKSMDLELKVGPKSQASKDLLLPGFTSVSSIDLTEVGYADGSGWRVSAHHTCRAVPDGMMLISRR